jgi:hypothetical protein
MSGIYAFPGVLFTSLHPIAAISNAASPQKTIVDLFISFVVL